MAERLSQRRRQCVGFEERGQNVFPFMLRRRYFGSRMGRLNFIPLPSLGECGPKSQSKGVHHAALCPVVRVGSGYAGPTGFHVRSAQLRCCSNCLHRKISGRHVRRSMTKVVSEAAQATQSEERLNSSKESWSCNNSFRQGCSFTTTNA